MDLILEAVCIGYGILTGEMSLHLHERWGASLLPKAAILGLTVFTVACFTLGFSFSLPQAARNAILTQGSQTPLQAFFYTVGLASAIIAIGSSLCFVLFWELIPSGELMAFYDLGKDLILYWLAATILFSGSKILVMYCAANPATINFGSIVAFAGIDLNLAITFPVWLIGRDLAYLAQLREQNKKTKEDRRMVTVVAGHIYARDTLFGVLIVIVVMWQLVSLYQISYGR